MVFVFAEQELIAQKRESRHSDKVGRKGVRFVGNKVLRSLIFTNWKTRHTGAARRQRIDLRELSKHLSEVQRVSRIQIMIHFYPKLIGVIA